MDNFTLLCAEDDLEALEDIKYLLNRYFVEVYTATNGDDAYDLYVKHSPSILLLDINMPKSTGLEVASKIRKVDIKTPIIFLTAHSDKDMLLQAINLQVSSYVIKPFKIKELKDSIIKAREKIMKKNNKVILENSFIWDGGIGELYYKTKEIQLTKKVNLLIQLLFKNRSQFLNIDEIYYEVSDNKNEDGSNSIVQLISRLKKKIKKTIRSEKFFIENVYGMWYRIK